MSEKYEKLKTLLKELFQLDQPDLDFELCRALIAHGLAELERGNKEIHRAIKTSRDSELFSFPRERQSPQLALQKLHICNSTNPAQSVGTNHHSPFSKTYVIASKTVAPETPVITALPFPGNANLPIGPAETTHLQFHQSCTVRRDESSFALL